MEIERDFEMFLPQNYILEETSQLFFRELQSFALRFQKQSAMRRIQNMLLLRLLKIVEPMAGYFGIVPQQLSIMAHSWQAILDYLYREGAIREPRFSIIAPRNDGPKFYFVSLKPALDQSLLNMFFGSFGQGYALDIETAIAKAVGEFLERYTLLSASYKNLVLKDASSSELRNAGLTFLEPATLSFFSQEQKNRNIKLRLDESSRFQWLEGRSVLGHKKCLIPAQLVFWDYFSGHMEEPMLRESNTNGGGGMFTRTEAILAGLYELIERDAFLIYWMNKIAPPRVDLQTIDDEEIKHMIECIHRYHLCLELLDITSDFGIPAFAAVILGSGRSPYIGVGAGSEWDPKGGIKSALMEAMAVYHEIDRVAGLDRVPQEVSDEAEIGVIKNPNDRLKFWTDSNAAHNIEWFLQGRTISYKEKWSSRQIFLNPERELRFVAEHLRKRGPEFESYYYEAHHTLLEPLMYHVVQVIVPALIPHYLYEAHAPWGAPRLHEIITRFGTDNKTSRSNSIPHPLL